MDSPSAPKIAKACEPCRVRKIRCNGNVPCAGRDCQRDPTACQFRRRARIRKSKHAGDSDAVAEATPQPEVYHSITEKHLSPKPTDSSQLFYGPSSNFAFLQQIRRGRLPNPHRPGFEPGMQRSIFFGTPSRVDVEAVRCGNVQLPLPTLAQAREFLDIFNVVSAWRLPFYTSAELDDMLQTMYGDGALPAQARANFFVILAIGALNTANTDVAESLMMQGKREAVIFDDAVTLPMLQFSILMADYQINIGRPNSTYLHLGVACRKAFALGLHKEGPGRLSSDNLQKHHTTLWLLYFYETCQALTMGRTSCLKLADISCPFPTGDSPVVGLCQMARIMESGAELIYGQRTGSLRQLYMTAEKVHSQLREFAETHHIASAHVEKNNENTTGIIYTLTLHNLYYLATILVFRPFMVASSAMRSGPHAEMWLRQACRHAVDAAQDSIVFLDNTLRKVELCRNSRYMAFFIDSSCGILLYDMVSQPSKYAYHIEYVRTALRTMESMVHDEPVLTAHASVQQILQAVEASIQGGTPAAPDPPGVDEMIFLSEQSHAPVVPDKNMYDISSLLDPSHFDLDVMTTDLFNFFPTNLSTPLDLDAQ